MSKLNGSYVFDLVHIDERQLPVRMDDECLLEEPFEIVPVVHQVTAGLLEVHLNLMKHSDLGISASNVYLRSSFNNINLNISVEFIGVQPCTIEHFLDMLIVCEGTIVFRGSS